MMHYGLLGKGIQYSLSPKIHTHVYEKLRLECDYTIIDGELEAEIEALKMLSGFNVTIPYKQAIMPYLKHMDEASHKIGAVNTVVSRSGEWFGYNTDYHGFKETVLSLLKTAPQNAIVLGTGGAAKAVYHVLKDLGAIKIWVVSRSEDTVFENERCITYEMLENRGIQSDLLVNCTPVGRGETMPVSENLIKLQGSVIDLMYNPPMTPILKVAQSLNIPYENGMMMLIVQALYADQLWFPEERIPIQELFEEIKLKIE